MNRTRNKGYTIIELLVGCVILSLVLTSVLIIFKNSWSVFRWADLELDQLGESRTTMNNIYRELRLSELIYYPITNIFNENEFKSAGNILVFNSVNDTEKRVMGYKLTNYRLNDKINRYVYDLCKITYDPGFDLNVEESIKTIGEPRILSSYVTEFSISRESPTDAYTIKIAIAPRHKNTPDFKNICKVPIKVVITGE